MWHLITKGKLFLIFQYVKFLFDFFRTDLPLLILIAGKDLIVDNKGALAFFKNTGTPPEKK